MPARSARPGSAVRLAMWSVIGLADPAMAVVHPDRGADGSVGAVNHDRAAPHRWGWRGYDDRWGTHRRVHRFHADWRRPAHGNLERYAGLGRRCIGGGGESRCQCHHLFGFHSVRFDACGVGSFDAAPLLNPMWPPDLLMGPHGMAAVQRRAAASDGQNVEPPKLRQAGVRAQRFTGFTQAPKGRYRTPPSAKR